MVRQAVDAAASAQMLDLPVSLTVLVGIAEVLAGIGAFVGVSSARRNVH